MEGVIVASGAGMDLTDARTHALSDDPGYYERRFSSTGPGWKKAASPRATSVRAGAPHRVVRGPGQSHERMVLVLSRDDGPAGSAMLRFIRRQARDDAASFSQRFSSSSVP